MWEIYSRDKEKVEEGWGFTSISTQRLCTRLLSRDKSRLLKLFSLLQKKNIEKFFKIAAAKFLLINNYRKEKSINTTLKLRKQFKNVKWKSNKQNWDTWKEERRQSQSFKRKVKQFFLLLQKFLFYKNILIIFKLNYKNLNIIESLTSKKILL